MNINDSILEAISTVVEQRLTKLQFDNTVICTIVDTANRDKGEYTVELSNNTRFYAYSNDYKHYSTGTSVYVLIPNGDWNARKCIIGRQDTDESGNAVSYVNPLDTIIEYETEDGGEVAIISAEFVSEWDSEEKPTANDGYSLEIPVTYIVEGKETKDIVYLTSANILGNPWDLPVPQRVSARVQAPVGGRIKVAPKDEWNGPLVTSTNATVTAEVRDVVYGFDLNSHENETLKITASAALTIPSGAESYQAELQAFWFNKNENNTYKGFEKGHIKNKTSAKEASSSKRTDPEATYYWLSWFQKEYGGEWQELPSASEDNFELKYNWSTSTIIPQVSFQARLYRNGKEFISNEITFISETYQETLNDPLLTVSIEGEKDYFNNYDLLGNCANIGPYAFRLKYGGWSDEKIKQFGLENKKVTWSVKAKDASASMIQSISQNGEVKIKPFYKITSNENNTIVAKVSIGGQTYTAEKVLRFATVEQSGNGYYIYVDRTKDYDFDSVGGEKTSELPYILYKEDKEVRQGVCSLNEQNYNTLQVIITASDNEKDITVARKPVALSIGSSQYRYEGPTSVAYNSYGTKISSARNDMKLYKDGKVIENVVFRFKTGAQPSAEWKIVDNKQLVAPNIYFEVKDKQANTIPVIIEALVDGQVVWTQGIVVFQNQYGSKFINDWDGNLSIDKNNKSIMSAMMGAGTKDSTGAFTGVFMGDVIKANDNSKVASGILGYQKGVSTFGFNTDGTAFIGKSGSGRIYFNGSSGVIESGNWQGKTETDPAKIPIGGKFDVNNGYIYFKQVNSNGYNDYLVFDQDGLKISSDSIMIASENKDIQSFISNSIDNGITASVSSKLDQTGSYSACSWNLTSNGFYINTSTEADDENYVFKVDSDGASIGGFNIGTIGAGWGSSDYPNSLYKVDRIDGKDYLAFLRIPGSASGNVISIRVKETVDGQDKVTTPFYVTRAGKLKATDAEITGDITATNLTLSGEATVPAAQVSGTLSAADINVSQINGGDNSNSITFTGSITCTNFTANTGGNIAGWTINNKGLSGTDAYISLDPTGDSWARAFKLEIRKNFWWKNQPYSNIPVIYLSVNTNSTDVNAVTLSPFGITVSGVDKEWGSL